MPFGIKPVCSKCQKIECSMWKGSQEGVLCNDCYSAVEKSAVVKTEEPAKPPVTETAGGPKIATRKSTRNTRNYKTRLNPYALPKPVAPKGKGRRIIFKKSVSYFIFSLFTILVTNENSIQEEMKYRLKAGNLCYYSVQTLLSSRLLFKNLKIKIYKTTS